MRKKILFLSFEKYGSFEEYEATLTSKVITELDKYYEITKYQFFNKNANLQRVDNLPYLHSIYLPFYWSGILKKMLNIIYIYLKNIAILKKHAGKNDLIWIGLTSSITNSFVFIYPLIFQKRKFFAQLLTPSVNKSKFKRYLFDTILRLNLKFYRYVGSDNTKLIQKRYKIPSYKHFTVEVGMPDYGFNRKHFGELKLIYIGTLQGREVWKSVEGLGLFFQENPSVVITYDIIGRGSKEEVKQIQQSIEKYQLSQHIKYHGPLNIVEVKEVFKKCNVGVQYAPITEYNQNSSTKTIEYCLAGMAVISTNIRFFSYLITSDIGVVCEDNPESFSIALNELYHKRLLFDSEKIREKFSDFALENVIRKKYIPNLDRIIKNK